MKKIVYSKIDWEKRTEEAIQDDKERPYNPRERDLDLYLEVEFLDGMRALECGLLEVAYNRVDIGKKYLEKSNRKDKIDGINSCDKKENVVSYYLILYYFDWFVGKVNREAEDILKECLEMEYIDMITDKRFRTMEREMEQMKNVRLSARFGQFELTREKIQKYTKVKSIKKVDKDIIYEFYDFYLVFVEYMLGIGNVSKEELNELFLEIFSEHGKGNRTVFFTFGGLNGIYEMYYLYYRYFLGLPEEEVTAANVYGSCRKGLLHWR